MSGGERKSLDWVRPLTGTSREDAELRTIEADVAALSTICVETMAQSLQFYYVADPWAVGTLPDYATPADGLEMRIQSLLGGTTMTSAQTNQVIQSLKNLVSLRCAARAVRQSANLSWHLRQDANKSELIGLVARVGDTAMQATRAANLSIVHNDGDGAQKAVALLKSLEAARAESEHRLQIMTDFPVPQRRMARVALWGFVIGAEETGKVCARRVLGRTE